MGKALDKPLTDKERRFVNEVYDKAHLEQQLAAVRAVEETERTSQAGEEWQKLARLDKALCRLDELKQAGWGGGLGFDGHIYGPDWVCTIGQMVEAVGETPLEAIEKALCLYHELEDKRGGLDAVWQ